MVCDGGANSVPAPTVILKHPKVRKMQVFLGLGCIFRALRFSARHLPHEHKCETYFLQLSNVTELGAYFGWIYIFGEFLGNFSTTADSLYEILEKKHILEGTSRYTKAFEAPKKPILNCLLLTY